MLNYEEQNIEDFGSTFSGIFITQGFCRRTVVIQIYRDGEIFEKHKLNAEKDSIEKFIAENIIEFDTETFYVDPDCIVMFEENLLEFPFIDAADDSEDIYFDPEEEAAIEAEREEAAEDAFTRFCDM